MAAKLSDAQLRAIEQQLQSNPAILQRLQAEQQKPSGGRQAYLDPQFQQSRASVLKSLGIDFPDAGDYQIQIAPDGSVHLDRNNWFQRNADWILPVATIGTGGAANALAGGGAAAGTGSAASTAGSGSLPAGVGVGETAATTGLAGPVAGLPVTAAPTVAGGLIPPPVKPPPGGGGGGSSLWSSLLPTIIGAGAGVGGAAIAAHGQSEAAKIQAEQADRALALLKEQYDLQRADLAPYRGLGLGAVNNLAYLGGINLPQEQPANNAQQKAQSLADQAAGMSQGIQAGLGTAGQSAQIPGSTPGANYLPGHGGVMPSSGQSLIKMQNPQTGLVHLIPPDQVRAAEQSGGVRI